MSDGEGMVERAAMKGQKQGLEALEKLLDVAQPEAVYGEPITAGDRTVITASEAWAAMGFGFGVGAGPQTEMAQRQQQGGEAQPEEGVGGGGGGGGGSGARPVAVINISPEGVRIDPVLDMSKLGLAALGALGGMLMMWGRMRRMNHR